MSRKKNTEEVVEQKQIGDEFPTSEINNGVVELEVPKEARESIQTINWRAKIKPEYIVFNKSEYKDEIEKKYGKPLGELDMDQVDDKYKLILLQGLKELADERGFVSIKYPNITATPEFVSAYCEIEWKGLNGEPNQVVGGGADATPSNTFSFAKNFLTAIAFNRAFVRAVKSYLKINLLGQDEIGPKVIENTVKQNDASPRAAIEAKLVNAGVTFEQFKPWYLKRNPESDCMNWQNINDIPIKDSWNILRLMKEREEEKKKI